MCRLAGDGAYYCGALSTLAPYKGLADTKDSPHIGTDEITRHDAPTGSPYYTATNNYRKAPQPVNPDYYQKATPSSTEFVQTVDNNGQPLNNPSSKRFFPGLTRQDQPATLIYNQATSHLGNRVGYDPLARHARGSPTSNYATLQSVAKEYNTGIHVVDSAQWGENGPGTGPPHTGGTKYSTAVQQDY